MKDGSGDEAGTTITAAAATCRGDDGDRGPTTRAWAHPGWSLAIPTVLLAVVAFLPILGNDFVDRDDPENFLENRNFRGLGRDQIRWAFTTFHHGVYQPLSWL